MQDLTKRAAFHNETFSAVSPGNCLLKIPDAKASLDALISRPYDNAESTFYAAKKILLAQYPLQEGLGKIRDAISADEQILRDKFVESRKQKPSFFGKRKQKRLQREYALLEESYHQLSSQIFDLYDVSFDITDKAWAFMNTLQAKSELKSGAPERKPPKPVEETDHQVDDAYTKFSERRKKTTDAFVAYLRLEEETKAEEEEFLQKRPDYHEYIKSERWREKVRTAKQNVGNRCQLCYEHGGNSSLHAHHRTYRRLGNELPTDITILCADCHHLFHDNMTIKQ